MTNDRISSPRNASLLQRAIERVASALSASITEPAQRNDDRRQRSRRLEQTTRRWFAAYRGFVFGAGRPRWARAENPFCVHRAMWLELVS